jgi:hypothetical protein
MSISLPAVRRLSVPLTPSDEELLALLRSAEGGDARELLRLASPTFSDAAFVRAVFELGVQRLRDEHEIHIYQQMAVDPEYVAETAGMRNRNKTRLHDRRTR